jgi:hypothetical protein
MISIKLQAPTLHDMSDAECHIKFTKFVAEQGIKVHRLIKAAEIPGKGYGIIATGSLKVSILSILSAV